jgi:aryl carrier-like protein
MNTPLHYAQDIIDKGLDKFQSMQLIEEIKQLYDKDVTFYCTVDDKCRAYKLDTYFKEVKKIVNEHFSK